MPYTFLIFLLGVVGFWITFQIRRMQKKRRPMTCPIGGKCKHVLTSRYSSLFGISTELYGKLYYLFVIGASSLLLGGLTAVLGAPLGILMGIVGAAAFAVSLFLTGIQAFVLRAWCSWCLASAAVNTAIILLEWKAFF